MIGDKFIAAANAYLQGTPNIILSGVLFVFAAFAVYVALRGTPTLKVAVILWFLLP